MLRHLTFVLIFTLAGYFLSTQIGNISGYTEFLQYVPYSLLAIGLYGAVYGIDLNELQYQKKTALMVVTLGVCFKVLFIGGVFYWLTGSPVARLLGAILGQIDPLSTAKLSTSSQLSPSSTSLLNTRASFDIAQYLAVYIWVQDSSARDKKILAFA